MVKSELASVQQDATPALEDPEDHPDTHVSAPTEDEILLQEEFDEAFYLEQHGVTLTEGETAVQHYLTTGWLEGYDPSEAFSTSWYLEINTDVREAGANPFLHFLRYGRDEGRLPCPQRQLSEAERRLKREMADMEGEFDPVFYVATNPDLDLSGETPLEHFAREGWRERRNPTSRFSISYYLTSNPDVAEHDLNPFWHYLVAGRDEGRTPEHPAGHKHAILTGLLPLAEERAAWKAHHEQKIAPLADPATALDRLRQAITASGHVVISIGHDNFQTNVGGVQLCIQHERDLLRDKGITHLNLHPRTPQPTLSEETDSRLLELVVTLDGEPLGALPAQELISAMGALPEGIDGQLVIHSLMGHAPELITELAIASNCRSSFLWLHDYFTLCPSYALQRNKVAFCNAPDARSVACGICVYGAEREAHLERIRKLVSLLTPTVLAPSRAAADYWSSKTGLEHGDIVIVPHMELTRIDAAGPTFQKVSAEHPVRIGFAGSPVAHKGWNAFEKLATELAGDPRLSFHYLGSDDPRLSCVTHHPVSVSKTDPEAMSNAIRAAGIDIVLKWTSWPETFCLAAYESLLGGARILTSSCSGNVADLVLTEDCGIVLDDMSALNVILTSNAIVAEAERARKTRASMAYGHEFSDMGLKTILARPAS